MVPASHTPALRTGTYFFSFGMIGVCFCSSINPLEFWFFLLSACFPPTSQSPSQSLGSSGCTGLVGEELLSNLQARALLQVRADSVLLGQQQF